MRMASAGTIDAPYFNSPSLWETAGIGYIALNVAHKGARVRTPQTVSALETLGRVRLSKSFFMRDFLYSEIANFHGKQNIPVNPDLAFANGTRLCEELLEPLHATFGQLSVRSGYRSPELNDFGNKMKAGCGSNDMNFAAHIWDVPDKDGKHGAM